MNGAIVFPEWLNANSTRAYPVQEASPRTSQDGTLTLPNSLVVDARFDAPASYVGGRFYVDSVEILPDRVSVSVGYRDSVGESTLVAVVVARTDSHATNDSYAFRGAGVHHSVIGSLSIGKIADAQAKGAGRHFFGPDSAPFEICTMHVSQPMVEYIALVEEGREVSRMSGPVALAAGENIRLTRMDDGTVRIDAIPGEGMDDCPQQNPLTPPVRTINGVGPDESGNLRLAGSECIQTSVSEASTIEILDLCSSSCCGCQELATLLEGLRTVDRQVDSLREMIYRSFNEQSGMISTLTAFLRP